MNIMAAHEQREASSDEETAAAAAGDLRRGPWTVEEDVLLVNYIAAHGEGRWNALARCAGLRRTGKSCRLRWLNYLRPDLRRGNMTAQEQLLILELHSRWGNRWSKIAQHLPGRTDNEIKNYWRTRVQKHARQLNCDVNSQQFKDLVRYLWMPRLLERIHHSDSSSSPSAVAAPPPPPHIDDVELSCTTAASSSSVSTPPDGMHQQLVSPPPPVAAESAPCGNDAGWPRGDGNTTAMSSMCDTTSWQWQPPHAEFPAGQLGVVETCWSDESLAGVYADMGLPDLGEAMWGASADDLWYTQIMGL